MRFGFVTCVQIGLTCMNAIYEVGGKLDLAVTLPDHQARAKSGRIYLDDFCEANGIPLVKSRNVNDPAIVDAVKAAKIDWLFIIGWSQIARQAILDAPRIGALGIHPTLLPEGRGRAPIPWAILKGLPRTGVTLFKLDEGVDTGPILDQAAIPVRPDTTATTLYAATEEVAVNLIRAAFPKIMAGTLAPQAQDEAKASVWEGRRPEDGRLDLAGSVYDAERLVRAVTRPYPGAYIDEEGHRLVVWRAKAAEHGDVAKGAREIRFRDGPLFALEWETHELAMPG
jgi:methionyl-tRNA formyltransferase